MAGNFNGHIGESAEGCEDQHGSYGFGVGNKEREFCFQFCVAMNIAEYIR